MNTLDCIYKRISVRNYTDTPVEDDKLNVIIGAGLQAPTAMNSRDIVLTVVRGKILQAINQAMQDAMTPEQQERFTQNGKFNFYRGGNALIVVSLGAKSVMPEQNTGCIMENMYLAATELGLGSCWINQFYSFTNDKIRSLLRLESGYKPYAALSVGYAADVQVVMRERDGKIVFLD